MADIILTDGDDVFVGTIESDFIYGRGGSDTVDGDAGDDRIYDGNGNPGQPDTDANSDILRGGAGDDYLSGAGGSDRLEGGDGDDQMAGDWENTPNPGNDTLLGGNGFDTLVGWGGNDILNGGTGADRMSGGIGNDRYYVDNIRDVVFEGRLGDTNSNGIDEVYSSISFVLNADAFNGNFENLQLIGSNNINGTGNGLQNRLIGNSGNNILNGMAGVDTMSGGAGNDRYYVDNVGDKVIEAASSGTDSLYASVTYSIAGVHVENLTLTGSSHINATGNGLANTLNGNTGNNTLNAGAGNDKLIGGAGADKLYGGSGADTFLFLSNKQSDMAARDIIYDFSRAEADKIDLSAIDARTTVSGNQAFTFIGTAEFGKKAGELRYLKKDGDTFIHADLNGDGGIDFSVRLDAAIDMRSTDFIL